MAELRFNADKKVRPKLKKLCWVSSIHRRSLTLSELWWRPPQRRSQRHNDKETMIKNWSRAESATKRLLVNFKFCLLSLFRKLFSTNLDNGAGCMVRPSSNLRWLLPRRACSGRCHYCPRFACWEDLCLPRPHQCVPYPTFFCRSRGWNPCVSQVCGDQGSLWGGVSFQTRDQSQEELLHDACLCQWQQSIVHRLG